MIRNLLFVCVALVGVGAGLVEPPKAQAAYGDWVVRTNGGGSYACSTLGDASSTATYLQSLGYTTTIYYKGQVYAQFRIQVWRWFGQHYGWGLIVDQTGGTAWINQLYNTYNRMGSQYYVRLTRVW